MVQLLAASAATAPAAPAASQQRLRRVWHVGAPGAILNNPRSTILTTRATQGGASGAAPSGGDSSSSGAGDASSSVPERVLFFESGNAVSLTSRRRRTELWPEHHFSREEAVQQQLKALQQNNIPYVDHGVEVMYRFANFDPFNPRTLYFGRQLDLGQFERFRRIMHTPPYATLLGHSSAQVLSTLEVSEHQWVARVEVVGAPHGDAGSDTAVYEFTMVQRVGGVHDGYWFTQSLVADGNDWQFMRGPRPGQAV